MVIQSIVAFASIFAWLISLTDVKPDNILANRGRASQRFAEIKLSDLGDSSLHNATKSNTEPVSGTPVYRAPEMILRVPSTTAVDIWALGATVRPSRQFLISKIT